MSKLSQLQRLFFYFSTHPIRQKSPILLAAKLTTMSSRFRPHDRRPRRGASDAEEEGRPRRIFPGVSCCCRRVQIAAGSATDWSSGRRHCPAGYSPDGGAAVSVTLLSVQQALAYQSRRSFSLPCSGGSRGAGGPWPPPLVA